jgi:hypothetical protein
MFCALSFNATGLARGPNVALRTVYINTLPHVVFVCTTAVAIDDEFLVDYGVAYNTAYLSGKPRTITVRR